jgi:hypothetical protein
MGYSSVELNRVWNEAQAREVPPGRRSYEETSRFRLRLSAGGV